MSQTIIVKLTCAGYRTGPFNIYDDLGNTLGIDITKQNLIDGYTVSVDDAVTMIILESTGKCKFKKSFAVSTFDILTYANTGYTQTTTACIWRHLTNIRLYNTFYGNIAPYIIEYPFAYQYQDEILQNVKDYTKAYEYYPVEDGVFNDNTRIETNDKN